MKKKMIVTHQSIDCNLSASALSATSFANLSLFVVAVVRCQDVAKNDEHNRHPGVNGGFNIMVSDWSVLLTSDWIVVG